MQERSSCVYEKQDEQKIKKRKELEERLKRLQCNGKAFMKKVDDKMSSMQSTRAILDKQGDEMKDISERFQKVMSIMNQNMFISFGNLTNTHKGRQSYDFAKLQPKKSSATQIVQKARKHKQIYILTGAGISKNCGIPTFRGPKGLYSHPFQIDGVSYKPEQFLTLQTFEKYPQSLWKWIRSFRSIIHANKPGTQHQLIDSLIEKLIKLGHKVKLLTTNIDGYHGKKVRKGLEYHEIHGNIDYLLCQKCDNKSKIDQQQCQLPPPNFKCTKCGNKTCRPWVMMFDERYDAKFDPTQLKNADIDFLFCIGTSLQTGLSVKLVSEAKKVVQINPQCNIKVGQVYQLQKQAAEALSQITSKL